MDAQANADRFSGFADLYDAVRPSPPPELGELLRGYAGGRVERAVDLGSGTGLSTRWCATWAAEVVGVEPSDDMRRWAESRTGEERVEYRPGWSHDTGLQPGSADAVVAVQALHWMDPAPTFAEAARLLRPGGVFAAVDCDWPPAVGDAAAESAWAACRDRARSATRALDPGTGAGGADGSVTLGFGAKAWNKDGHEERLRDSGWFSWSRQLALHSTEPGDAGRFVDLLRSQGDVQALLRRGATDDELGLGELAATLVSAGGELARQSRSGEQARPSPWGELARPFVFTYRALVALRS